MAETPEEFYSKGAEQFAEKYSIDDMPEEYLRFLDEFSEKVGEGKILDAGCGPGRDTDYLSQKGFETIGVDKADGMIEHARENKKGSFRIMGIESLEFGDEEFDGVWCNAVMHFFPPGEMKEIVEELDRVLKQGGKLYISFKIGEGIFIRERYGSEVKQYLIKEERARELLEDQGFEILSTNKSEVAGTKIMNILAEDKK